MAQGKRWILTDKRKDIAIAHFMSQGSIESLRFKKGMDIPCHETLSKQLKVHDINIETSNRIGLNTMKQDMYNKVYKQDNNKDTFNAGMKYLDKYDLDIGGSVPVDDVTDAEIIKTLTIELKG